MKSAQWLSGGVKRGRTVFDNSVHKYSQGEVD